MVIAFPPAYYFLVHVWSGKKKDLLFICFSFHLTTEQKAQPATVVQPVQFCSVGQSFAPPLSYSFHSQPSTHIKRTSSTLAEQKKDETVDTSRAEMTSSYPSDREPGEGMDSEHITVHISSDSEYLPRELLRKSKKEETRSKNEMIEGGSSEISERSTFDHAISSSSHSSANTPTQSCVNHEHCNSKLSAEVTPALRCEQAKASEDLKRENATLRSELHEAREELQKRLDDLEAQRRAEAEARTRLKQLSRKHASQSVEKEEQDKEWRAQLEREKAETEKLRKAMAALETEMKRRREARENDEREGQEEEKNKAIEDRESEMIELNMQLKKQLAEVKAQLALEREERKREEEEMSQITNTDMNVKKELSMELEELKAELEELKRSRKEDSVEQEKLSIASSPLKYLTLHDDELNSNTVDCDKLLPSPEQHLLFCQSTNQRNMLVSQADLIQGEGTAMDPEHSPTVVSDLEDPRQNYLVGSSMSDHKNALSDIQNEAHAPSDLAKEVKRLEEERAKETERANQYQVKLEALQSQVNNEVCPVSQMILIGWDTKKMCYLLNHNTWIVTS